MKPLKSGQMFEIVNTIIQTSFKDNENTQIFQNYKIKNTSGRDREIDIMIISKINDLEIKIAVECKDYKSKVSVEKIEAFTAKCQRIPSINKMVFISKKGFQTDAINAAKESEISLFLLDEITETQVIQWMKFPIPSRVTITRHIKTITIFTENKQNLGINNNDLVYIKDIEVGLPMFELVKNLIQTKYPLGSLPNRKEQSKLSSDTFTLCFEVNDVFIKLEERKIGILQIWVTIVKKYEERVVKIALNSFRNHSKSINKAESATIIADDGELISFVKKSSEDKIEIYKGNDLNGNYQYFADLEVKIIDSENNT